MKTFYRAERVSIHGRITQSLFILALLLGSCSRTDVSNGSETGEGSSSDAGIEIDPAVSLVVEPLKNISIDFGMVFTTVVVERTVTFSNTLSSALEMLSLSFESAEFSIIDNTCGVELPPQSSCNIRIRFSASQEKSIQSVATFRFQLQGAQKLSKVFLKASVQHPCRGITFPNLAATFRYGANFHLAQGQTMIQPDGKILLLNAAHEVVGGQINLGGKNGVTRMNCDGTLDATFGVQGVRYLPQTATSFVGPGSRMVRYGDKILVVSQKRSAVTGIVSVIVSRLLKDGAPDPLFGADGIVTVHPNARFTPMALSVQSDGKILVGFRDGNLLDARSEVLRLNANGAIDLAFGTNGRVYFLNEMGIGTSNIVLQIDGKILVETIQDYSSNSSDSRFRGYAFIHRLLQNGAVDTAFGTAGVVTIARSPRETLPPDALRLIAQPDGKILHASRVGVIRRLNPDGTIDTGFGDAGTVEIDGIAENEDLVLQADGKILVGAGKTGAILISRLLPNGAFDTSFGIGGKHIFATTTANRAWLGLQADGRILVSAGRSQVGDSADSPYHMVFRLKPDGTRE